MGQLAIVNAPSSFTFIWSVIKSWLSKETAEKVDILGSDYKKVLLELVDADNLPSTLGGNCRCEGGCHLSSVGPWLDGRVGWGPKSKAKSGVAAQDVSDISDQYLENPKSLANATREEEKAPTGAYSSPEKANGIDAQEDDPSSAEHGLQQDAVEPVAEVVMTAVTVQA